MFVNTTAFILEALCKFIVAERSYLQNVAGTDIAWARMGQGLGLYSVSYREVLDPQPTFSGSDRVNVNKW